MAHIYVGQKLILNFTDSDDRDMSLIDFKVDYWKPSNITNTADGTIDTGDIVTTSESPVVEITIDKGILDEATRQRKIMWRFQIIDNATGIGWTPMTVDVLTLGTQT